MNKTKFTLFLAHIYHQKRFEANKGSKKFTTAKMFGLWGGTFAFYECSILFVRKQASPWNSVVAGAATGATLVSRNGIKAMIPAAVVGGVLLGIIEGVSHWFSGFGEEDFSEVTPYGGPITEQAQESNPFSKPQYGR